VSFARLLVKAQRREAWGELTADAASSVVYPRPYGRSAFTTPRSIRTWKTHRLKTCATGECARGCPCPGAGVADERSHDQSACGGSVPGEAKSASSERRAGARSERPVTGMGSPEPRESLRFTYDPYHSRVCQWPCMAHESAGTLVTGRASLPSALATYNCITPLRSEPNRSERPSGDGHGW